MQYSTAASAKRRTVERMGRDYPPLPTIPTSEDSKISLHSAIGTPVSTHVQREEHPSHITSSTVPCPVSGQNTELGATRFKVAQSQKRRSDTSPSAHPPIIIPSLRWTAKPETFTVRVEPEFTVTCTVVHPVTRTGWFSFNFGWSTTSIRTAFENLQIGLGFLTGCFRPQVKDEDYFRSEHEGKRNKRLGMRSLALEANPKKVKSKARTGVAIEMDVIDDSVTHRPVDSGEHSLPPIPNTHKVNITPSAPPHQSRRPRAQTTAQTANQKALKSMRRNSGWAGVFSLSPPSPSSPSFLDLNNTEGTGVDEHGRITHFSSYGYEIDTASCTLVLPDVAIGVAYSVKEELEQVGGSVQEDHREIMYEQSEVGTGTGTETGSEESWLIFD